MAACTYNGTEYPSLRAACKATGADYYSVRRRVALGWTVEEALTAPLYARKPLPPAPAACAKIAGYLRSSVHDHNLMLNIAWVARDYLKDHPHGYEGVDRG